MLEGVQGIRDIQSLQGMQGAQGINSLPSPYQMSASAAKTKEEFLAIFYKELLKQVFKPPKFGFGEEENNSLTGVFGSDLLVERLALELAQSGAFSAQDLIAADLGNDIGIK